jgi:hypothetical protein
MMTFNMQIEALIQIGFTLSSDNPVLHNAFIALQTAYHTCKQQVKGNSADHRDKRRLVRLLHRDCKLS